MTTPAAAKPQHNVIELTILGFMSSAGILIGGILIVAGVLNGNGGYFDGPDLSDLALKVTMISIGSTLVSAGFLALLAAVLLSGVKKIVENTQRGS
jgi:hypothetical protein